VYIVLVDVLLDASAVMAVILNEENRDKVVTLTKNALLLSPEMISFEIGNALISLFKRHKLSEKELLEAYKKYTLIPLRIIKVDVEKALKIACKYNI
jgi:predicted nucleic acid-binding protein